MSVLQSQQEEVRYLRRKNLEQESRIVGNALRDQIRQYGVDCVYYKLNQKDYTDFKNIIDQNAVLKHAYGYDMNPDYTLSAHMITYADVQQDVIMLNKIGIVPDTTIDFNFDRIDFACALAPKIGQLKEYKVDETPVVCKVPDISAFESEEDIEQAFPFQLGTRDVLPMYRCRMLSGWLQALVDRYEFDKECTISCRPYEHTQFNVQFPANDDLYRSLKYKIQNDDYLETKLWLTYKVTRVQADPWHYEAVLSGFIHGSVLFYDIEELGKYSTTIHPSVGDIVEIDFPDDQNKEKYEITECYDKQLTNDGLNPLLHRYIWRCKARRHISSYEENAPSQKADEKVVEMNTFRSLEDRQVTQKVELYDEIGEGIKEDAVYGGMDGVIDSYDIQAPSPWYDKFDFVDDGSAVELMRFAAGSRLLTNGYDLIFASRPKDVSKPVEFVKIAVNSVKLPVQQCMLEQNLRWLKATDSQIVFVNVEGESTVIACDLQATQGQLELCLNSLYDKSLDDGRPINEDDQNFFKFKGTRTYMWSDGDHLYAKLASNDKLFQIDGQMPHDA